jgi:hypothetical protein
VPWITGQEEVEPFSNRVLGTDWWTMLPVIAAVVAVPCWPPGMSGLRRVTRPVPVVVGLAAVVGWVSVVRITGNTPTWCAGCG